MPDNNNLRSERDLLIRLDTKFESMSGDVGKIAAEFGRLESKVDAKFDAFNQRLDEVTRDIKEELKSEYVTKKDFDAVVQSHKELRDELKKYAPLSRFEPVEEVHKDVAKRLRTLLISVGVCVLIAAASAPTWITVYKTANEVAKNAGK